MSALEASLHSTLNCAIFWYSSKFAEDMPMFLWPKNAIETSNNTINANPIIILYLVVMLASMGRLKMHSPAGLIHNLDWLQSRRFPQCWPSVCLGHDNVYLLIYTEDICVYVDDCLFQTAIVAGITSALLPLVTRADKESRGVRVGLALQCCRYP